MKKLCWIFLLAALLPGQGCSEQPEHQQPNILLIMADDLGYSDLGVHGNQLVETPHLDRLAGESVQFSQFYVTPVCATTRASLLTGKHFLRTGVSHVHGGKDFLHLDEVTLAQELKKAGYATGMWGKWHSGKTPGYFPWERGFDEAFMARLYKYRNNDGVFNGTSRKTSGWVTEVLTNDAIDFITRHRDGPFFAYLPFLTCHAPLDAPEEYREKYLARGLSENLSTLYGMVDHLDHHIGRLLKALEDLALDENTIVLFLSDNGPAVINNWLSDEDRRIRYVNGFRGHKGNIWENGIKSPLFVRWKGHCLPGEVPHLADVCDLFPTLLALAGRKEMQMPDDLDGRSIIEYLKPEAEVIPGKEIFLYANPAWPPSDKPWTPEGIKDEYRPWKYAGGDNLLLENQIIGIRNEDSKLLLNPGITDGSIPRDEEGYVLVNIRKDPREKFNVSAREAGVFKDMKASLKQWYREVYGSEHAFEMPVYQIGPGTDVSYPVLAYGPRACAPGVKGASGYITGYHTPGDWSSYDIRVFKAGAYTAQLSYHLEGHRALEFVLEVGEGIRSFTMLPGEGTVDIPDITLPEGMLRFTLRNQSGLAGGDLKLFEINYRMQDD